MALDPRIIIAAAEKLDNRRRAQISRQKDTITRLVAENAELKELLGATVAEGMENEMGKRKDAFLAGFAAGETEDDALESWKEYKEGLDDEEPAEGTDDE